MQFLDNMSGNLFFLEWSKGSEKISPKQKKIEKLKYAQFV